MKAAQDILRECMSLDVEKFIQELAKDVPDSSYEKEAEIRHVLASALEKGPISQITIRRAVLAGVLLGRHLAMEERKP